MLSIVPKPTFHKHLSVEVDGNFADALIFERLGIDPAGLGERSAAQRVRLA
jgi:hypothetical protein